jgi:hypothetical protein
LSAGQTALNGYLINAFESNGGIFAYNTRQYLASFRLDHRMNDTNQLSFSYRYGHDLEQAPDVQSLTGYSSGSSIRGYESTASGSWFQTFKPALANELKVQSNYNESM